jgi:hypothetical protein
MTKQKKFYQYVGVQAAFIIVIGGIIAAGMNIWHSRSELAYDNQQYKTEIASLKDKLKDKDSEIQRLETQLTPFKTIALEKYTGSEQEALRKLADELEKLKDYVDPFKKPISYAVADIEVIIESDEQINKTYMDRGGLLAFVKDRQSLLLVSDTKSKARQNGKGEITYKGSFQIQSSHSHIGKPVEILRESDIIQIEFNKIPENSNVLGGKASVIINGNLRFDFEIPQQQMNGNKIFISEIKDKFPPLIRPPDVNKEK